MSDSRSFESLETRRLMHAEYSAAVNFTPLNAPKAPGMLVDYGSTFDYRRGGHQYGWSTDMSANAVDLALTKVQRNDTFIRMPQGGTWEMTVPNGEYTVYVVAGDQSKTGERMALSVEGSIAVAGMTKGRKPFLEGAVTVNVTDGKLTVAGAGAFGQDKINYLSIRSSHALSDNNVSITTTIPNANETGPVAGRMRIERSSAVGSITVPLTVTGTGTNAIDYGRIGKAVTFIEGVTTIDLPINVVDDQTVESDETVIVTLGPVAGYEIGQGSATVTIKDAAAPQSNVPTTISWQNKAAGVGRGEALSAVVNNRLYTFGGYQNAFYTPVARVDSYDPATNTWTQHANMPERLTHSGTATDGQYVYLTGGYPGTSTAQAFSSRKVYRYDPSNDTWTTLKDLPAARGGSAAAVFNGHLFNFGGSDSNRNDVKNVWSLDLSNPNANWVNRSDMPVSSNHFQTVVLNGAIWAVAGQQKQDAQAIYQRFLYKYDPDTETWTKMADLINEARSHSAAATIVHDGRIYIMGGETSTATPGKARPMNNVEVYDPATNKWSALPSLPGLRKSGVAGSINGQIIYSIGYWNETFYNNTWVGVPV